MNKESQGEEDALECEPSCPDALTPEDLKNLAEIAKGENAQQVVVENLADVPFLVKLNR